MPVASHTLCGFFGPWRECRSAGSNGAADEFLFERYSGVFLLFHYPFVKLFESGIKLDLCIELVTVAERGYRRSFYTNDPFSKGTVYRFDVNHAILSQHWLEAAASEQLCRGHVLAQIIRSKHYFCFCPLTLNALNAHDFSPLVLLFSCWGFQMMQETDLELSGIIKVGSVYFMADFRVWRAANHLFLITNDARF